MHKNHIKPGNTPTLKTTIRCAATVIQEANIVTDIVRKSGEPFPAYPGSSAGHKPTHGS